MLVFPKNKIRSFKTMNKIIFTFHSFILEDKIGVFKSSSHFYYI